MDNSLDKSLMDSVSSEDLVSIGETVTEPLLDSLLDNETLKDIPIIGTIAKLYSVGKDVRNYFYTRKIYDFLFCLKDIPLQKRKEFIDEISNSEKKHQEFGETVLLLLERADNLKKPVIIGNVIKALINENISYEHAMRICAMVDKCYYPDLKYLLNFEEGKQENSFIAENLLNVGFLEKTVVDFGKLYDSVGEKRNDVGDEYALNIFGEKLIKYGFENL